MFSNKFEKLMSLQNDYIERINKNAVKLDKQLNFLNQVQNSLDKQMGGAGLEAEGQPSEVQPLEVQPSEGLPSEGQPLNEDQLVEYRELYKQVGLEENLADPDDESLDRKINTKDLAIAKSFAEKAIKPSEDGQLNQDKEETNVEEQVKDSTDNSAGEGDKKSLSSIVSASKVGEQLVQKEKEATKIIEGLENLTPMQQQDVKSRFLDKILELQLEENKKLKTNLQSLRGTIDRLGETTDARLANAQKILESTKKISAPFNIDELSTTQKALVQEQLEKLQSGESSVADVMEIFDFKKSSTVEKDREEN